MDESAAANERWQMGSIGVGCNSTTWEEDEHL